jgi:predicted SAM-dependent methyltransferase
VGSCTSLLKHTIHQFNSFVAWTRKSRRITPTGNLIKVNFGSALAVTDGWINVDGSPHLLFAGMPKPLLRLLYRVSDASNWCGTQDHYIKQLREHRFVHHNLEYGLPFPDGSVDYLYSSHVLEHFYPDMAEQILRDAYRVLKMGSRARICVPDLHHAFELYTQGFKEQALTYFFVSSEARTLYQHRYMYDYELLCSLLRTVGFTSVERCAYQKGLVPDISILDNRPDETLYVEAVK